MSESITNIADAVRVLGALPVPVGPEPQLSEVEVLRARVAELLAERQSTNEALDDAVRQLRVDRDRIARLERLVPKPRPADELTALLASTQVLREDAAAEAGEPR